MNTANTASTIPTVPGHTLTVKPRQARWTWTCECGVRSNLAYPVQQHAATLAMAHADNFTD